MQGDKTAQVKAKALELGFDLCGVALARPVDPARLDKWFAQGWHASLSYVKDRRAERLDPSLLIPGARSVIALAASYGPGPDDPQPVPGELLIARYARGRDYHNVILKPARKLAAWLREQGANVYCEVDTGAVLEKYWAQEAGLGWIGKNGCLIHERLGSWLLLGALITDLELEADAPQRDRCGDCALCIPACPTQAIPEPRYVDANKCLAFHTIEHRGEIPPELAAKAGGRLFGCDACQDVCPWNRKAPPGRLVQLRARTPSLHVNDVLSLTAAEARRRFEGTPLLRAGRDGLVRTALAVSQQSPETLRKFSEDEAPGVRAQAHSALSRSAD
ncbi:MAG TPA: tRNA epoxyqueuosine(34) reductase QueG [Myxococcales bacterium]|jgi:epoxyqueuosine reductase|nr:tRNA epoxyqueuosine(34) reductase QueG [Myxococcales bacterium]